MPPEVLPRVLRPETVAKRLVLALSREGRRQKGAAVCLEGDVKARGHPDLSTFLPPSDSCMLPDLRREAER